MWNFKNKSPKSLAVLLLWIASIAGAYTLGHKHQAIRDLGQGGDRQTLATSSTEAPAVPEGLDKEAREAAIVEAAPDPEEELLPEAASERVEAELMIPVRRLPPEELEHYLLSGLTSRDHSYRALVLAQVLYQLDAENAPALLPTFQRMVQARRSTNPIFIQFMLRWANVDGSAAMEALEAFSPWQRPYGLTDPMITSWAEGDPQRCLAYLTEQGLDNEKTLLYLKGVARRDPAIFEEFIANMEHKGLQRAAIVTVAKELENVGALGGWAERAINMPNQSPSYVKRILYEFYQYEAQGRSMADWVDRNADSPWLSPDAPIGEGFTGSHFFAKAAEQWAKADGPAALQWVTRNASDPRMGKHAFDVLMREWSRSDDGPGNIAWIRGNLNDPRVTQGVVGYAMSAWARSEPEAAARWVERNIGSKNVTGYCAAGDVVKQWVKDAPADALDWIGSLPGDTQKWPYYYAAQEWPQGQLDDFATWLNDADADSRFDRARSELAKRYLDSDRQTALYFANTVVDRSESGFGLYVFGRALMEKDPEAALAWLPNSGVPEKYKEKLLLMAPPPGSER